MKPIKVDVGEVAGPEVTVERASDECILSITWTYECTIIPGKPVPLPVISDEVQDAFDGLMREYEAN